MKIRDLLFVLFLCASVFVAGTALADNKSIFILHSYHQEYPWTSNQNTGFIQTLEKKCTVGNINFSTEYLDTKRIAFDKEYQELFFHYLKQKFSHYSPDVIYSTDDNALTFLLQYKEQLFGDAPVVFSGVNNIEIEKELNRQQYTGAFEKKEVAPNLVLLKDITIHPENILFVGDGSTTDQAIERQIRDDIASQFPNQKFAILTDTNLSHLVNQLESYKEGVIFLTTIGGIRDEKNEIAPLWATIDSIAQTGDFTILSMEDAYLAEGVLGGYVTSGYSQGDEAANIAIQIIQGKLPASIPLVKESPNEFMFNYPQLKKHGINISQLPEQSIILNKPLSFYDQYKYYFWSGILFLIFQTVVIVLLVNNIHTRKRAEISLQKASDELEFRIDERTQELAVSEAKFRNIIESSPMGVHLWELSSENKLIFTGYNPAADKILKTDNSQFLGREILDAFPALIESSVPEKYREVCETGVPLQTEQVNYEDDTISGAYEVNAFQASPGKLASFFLDITDKLKMQAVLAQSEERMQLALEAADVAIWDWNIQTGVTYFSPRYFTMLRYSPGELPSTFETWNTLLHEDDREAAMDVIRQCLERKQGWDVESRLQTKGGDYRWIRWRGNIVDVDDDGNLLRASGTHVDITTEKQAEEILKESEATLKSILVAVPVGIGLVHNRVFRWVSERIVEMTGYEADELIGKSARMLYATEEEFLRVGTVKYDQLKSGNFGEVDTVWQKKSGELIDINLRSSAIDPNDLSLGVTFSALDITRRLQDEVNVRRLEKQIQQSKNIESLGVLAGGIAHDFNNIQMAVLGNLSLVKLSIPPESKEHVMITEAEKASLRAKELTQQLLTFSKGGEPIKETASMSEVIADSTNFILRGSSVACNYDLPDDIWLVDIDKGQMSQVIQNIILNAKNAMPKGGTISISCQNVEDTQKENIPLLADSKYIKIKISDQGVGIPAEILDKIFEPYFTTKQEGSGLGLSITYSIIARHQGFIYAQSEVGVGTSFFIYLPASDQKVETPVVTMDVEHDKKLRILVMDDEEMVRSVSRAILTKLGHEVLLAVDGHEAVNVFKQSQETIDIVIMDLTIPGGMGGKEAAKEILNINPGAKLIVSSGYSNDPVMANCQEYGFCAAIVKPYRLQELTKVISQVMA